MTEAVMEGLRSLGRFAVPVAPVEPSERTLHGETVVDDFGWMRDHGDPRLLEYLTEERKYFDEYVRAKSSLVEELIAESARLSVRDRPFSWQVGYYEYVVQPPESGGRHTRYVRRDLRGGAGL